MAHIIGDSANLAFGYVALSVGLDVVHERVNRIHVREVDARLKVVRV